MTRALAGLLALSLVVACRTPSPGVPLGPGDPRPAQLVDALVAAHASRHALRARARLDLRAEDLRFDRPQRLAAERPARLRVEVLALFDQIAAVIVTDGATYQVYDTRSHELEQGAVDAGLLWRIARVDLEPERAVDLVLGAPRPDPALRPGEALAFPNGDIATGRLDAQGLVREQFRFDAGGRLIEATAFDAAGVLAWRARYGDYRALAAPVGGEQWFAHDLSLEFPRVEARARLRFDQVALVDRLPDELFVLSLPDHVAPARGAGGGAR